MAKRSNFYEVGKKILSNKYLTDIYDLDDSNVVKEIATIKHTFSSFKSAISVIQYYSERLDCKGEDLVLHYKLDGKIFDIKYKFNFSRIILDSLYDDYNDYNVYIYNLGFTPIWVLCILDILRRNEDKFKGKELSPYKRKTKEESKPKYKQVDDTKEKPMFPYNYDPNNSDLENFKNIIKVYLKRNSIQSNLLRLIYDDDVKELCNCIKNNFTIRDLVRCFRRTLSSSLSDCPKELLVCYIPITLNFTFNTSLNVIEIKNSDGEYSYGVTDDEPVDNYLIMYVLAYVIQNVEKVSRIVGINIGESIVPTNSFLESKDSTKEKTYYESVVEESNPTPKPTTVTSDNKLVIDISNNSFLESKNSTKEKTDYESVVAESNPTPKPSINTAVTSDKELVIDISGTGEFRGSFDKVIKFENAIKAFDSKFKILNINVNFINNQLTIQFDSKLSNTVIKELLLTTD